MSKILYVKDLFNKKSEFKTLEDLSNDLKKKTNLLSECNISKKMMTKSKFFDIRYCIHFKILKENVFAFQKGTLEISNVKYEFY